MKKKIKFEMHNSHMNHINKSLNEIQVFERKKKKQMIKKKQK